MSRRKKGKARVRAYRNVYEFGTCTLALVTSVNGSEFELTGGLPAVGLLDRELIANRLGAHLEMDHDEAYALVWNATGRSWESEGEESCQSSATPKF